jgi:hypothetical protein
VSLAELSEAGDRVEAQLLRSGHAGSIYCSGLAWQLAAWDSQEPSRQPAIFHHTDSDAWFIGARGPLLGFHDALQPLEVDWSFGFSLIDEDSDPGARVDRLLGLFSDSAVTPPLIWLGGVPKRGPFLPRFQEGCRRRFKVLAIPGTDCAAVDLSDGLDAWMSRRSAKFRANLRRLETLNTRAGHRFEWHRSGGPLADVDRLLDLIEAIEKRSWKGSDPGENIFLQPRFRAFYASLFRKAAAAGELRLALARDGTGTAMAYAIGGRLGPVFRGFQMSYDQAYRPWSPGNWIQARMLPALIEEGVTDYDLGMAILGSPAGQPDAAAADLSQAGQGALSSDVRPAFRRPGVPSVRRRRCRVLFRHPMHRRRSPAGGLPSSLRASAARHASCSRNGWPARHGRGRCCCPPCSAVPRS